jgi:hypothetical protein
MFNKLFLENLEKFKPYEERAGVLIEQMNGDKIKKICNNNKYDFKTVSGVKYEVKAEPSSLKTNNFFIEHFAYNKPSGLAITKAHFYIITDTKKYYLISVEELKKIVLKSGKICYTRDKLTIGHLIKTSLIIESSFLLGEHIDVI